MNNLNYVRFENSVTLEELKKNHELWDEELQAFHTGVVLLIIDNDNNIFSVLIGDVNNYCNPYHNEYDNNGYRIVGYSTDIVKELNLIKFSYR